MTLRDLYASLMVKALKDDLRINYSRRIVACEFLALLTGWSFLCDENTLAYHMNAIGACDT